MPPVSPDSPCACHQPLLVLRPTGPITAICTLLSVYADKFELDFNQYLGATVSAFPTDATAGWPLIMCAADSRLLACCIRASSLDST